MLVPYYKRGQLNRLIDSFEKDLISHFNTFFEDEPLLNPFNIKNLYPKSDLVEQEDKFVLESAVPGMSKNDVKVDVKKVNNKKYLTISGEIKFDDTKNDKNYVFREIKSSSFSRSFTLPDNVEDDKIEASVQDGMLKLSIPKKINEDKIEEKQIEIK